MGERLGEQPEHVSEREKKAEFTAPSWQVVIIIIIIIMIIIIMEIMMMEVIRLKRDQLAAATPNSPPTLLNLLIFPIIISIILMIMIISIMIMMNLIKCSK